MTPVRHKKINTSKLRCYLMVILLFGLSLPAWGQEKKGLKKIRIGTPSRGMFSFPLFVAQAKGFNQGEGLEVEIITISASVAIQSLISGDLDFITPIAGSTRAAVSGLPVRVVAALMIRNDQSLLVRPDIRRMEDLRGKILGVSSFKSTPDVSLRLALRKYGLVPDVDVKIIALGGGTSLRLAALQAGRIDGTSLAMPYNKVAVTMGLRELVHMSEVVGDRPYAGLATTTRIIQSNPEAVVLTIRAALKAIAFIKEQRQETLQLMSKELGIKDSGVTNLVYDDSVKLFSDNGIPSDAAMMEEIASGKETQGVNREVRIPEVADWSFAREAYKGLKGSR